MKKRKLDAILSIIFVSLIVVLINFVGSFYFVRADFTKNKIYTISNSTKKILKNLDDKLHIKFYVSKNLPPRVLPIKRNVQDLLDEYENYGNGKVDVSILEPEKNKDIENDAKTAGISPVQLNVIGANKEEVQSVYIGIAIYYKDKTKSIPVVMSISNLEYQLTSNILKLTQKNKEHIVFLDKSAKLPPNLNPQMRAQLMAKLSQGHSIYKDSRAIAKALEEQYSVSEKKLKDGEQIEDNTSVLIINGADKLTKWEQYAIDQYLMKGGNVIFLDSGMKLTPQMLGQPKDINYLNMLAKYGLILKKNFVFDLYNYPVMLPTSNNMNYLTPFPLWIKVSPKQLGKDLPNAIKSVGALGFTFASSVETEPKEGIKYLTIASTSGKSWAREDTVFVNPDKIIKPEPSELQVYKLAVLAQGKFSSAFNKNSLPKNAKSSDFIEKAKKKGSVLLIGDSAFITDRSVRNFNANALFFLNLTDYITNNNALTGIRSRGSGIVPINPMSDEKKEIIKWIGILLIPFFVILFGIIRMFFRKKLAGRQ